MEYLTVHNDSHFDEREVYIVSGKLDVSRQFKSEQQYEIDEKAGKHGELKPNPDVKSNPVGYVNRDSYINPDLANDRIIVRSNLRETVAKREGCKWTHGDYSEMNPSSLCNLNGNTLPLTPLTAPVSSTHRTLC